MAYSYDEIYKQIYDSGAESLKKQKNALNTNADEAKKLYESQAATSINAQKAAYDTEQRNVREQYEESFRRNEVQKLLNERYLERKAAEMGLTDSGMNRTQLTANQLSHANQQGRLETSMQKDINTLAAAMRNKISEIETNRDAKIAEVDMNLRNNIAQLESDYAEGVRSSVDSFYDNEMKDADNAAGALNDLVGLLSKSNDPEDDNFLSPTAKKAYIESYINQYGFSPALKSLLGRVGYNIEQFSEDAYNEYMKNYMFNPNISRDEKINRFRAVYSNYGPPPDSIYRAIENAPNRYTGGISLETLINAIGRN